MNILLISDIHANFPALTAVDSLFHSTPFKAIINAGDSLVYAPFPNETLQWLRRKKVVSILGNTDKKVIKLLKGKSFKKPGKEEKRVMYTWTAETISPGNIKYLFSLPTSTSLLLPSLNKKETAGLRIDIFHGSPARDHEFLFPDTPEKHFQELAALTPAPIVIVGHSHTPFHKYIDGTHFINPGSVGRMFDGNPTASCAILTIESSGIQVTHHRVPYPIENVITTLREVQLPSIYSRMYREGRKLN